MSMKIAQFKNLIQQLPVKQQSFEIYSKNWKVSNQNEIVNYLFNNNQSITLSRFDLTNSVYNLEEFVIKTLMWGYPTKGRGTNIDKILEPMNFNKLISLLDKYSYRKITLEQFSNDVNSIPNLGLSTLSKFAYFLNTRIDSLQSLILDRKIIDVINSGRFQDFEELRGIKYNSVIQYYDYLKLMSRISTKLNIEVDKIELFLFMFGNNLSELKGEELQ